MIEWQFSLVVEPEREQEIREHRATVFLENTFLLRTPTHTAAAFTMMQSETYFPK